MASGETKIEKNKESTEEEEDCHRNKQQTALHNIKHCDACKYDDTIEEATGFCVSCTEYLCQTCCRGHRKNKLTRNHTLLKDEEMPEDVELFRKLNELTKCTIHPENDIAYECVDHKVDICVVCLSETHRKCGDIRDFALGIEQVDTNANLFDKNNSRLEEIGQKREKMETQIVRDGNYIENKLKAFRDQLKRQVDALIEKLLAEVKETVESETKKMSNTKQDCAEIQTKVQKGKLLLEIALKHATKRQYEVVSRHLNKLNQTISDEIETIMTKPIQRVCLKKDTALLSAQSIGEVTHASFTIKCLVDEDNGGDVLSDNENESQENEASALHASLLTKDVKKQPTCHGIRTSSDQSECTVAAIEMLANGNIIVADTNNSRLKLFTGQFNLLDETSLPGNPIDMCINDKIVYICCSSIRKIFWLELKEGDKFSQACRSFATRFKPISVSMFESNLLVLFSSADYDGNVAGVVNIEIRKGNGRILSQITYDSSNPQMQYIKDAKRIHDMPSSEILMAQNNLIFCYEVDQPPTHLDYVRSICLHRLSDGLLKARGMAIDSESNVYVCGTGSNNVLRMSFYDDTVNRVVVPQIETPISVLVDEKNDRLLVGCTNDDNVHSFSMT